MCRLKILICGDSFAASRDELSWTTLLKSDYDVNQLGWDGCGEYKIYQQIINCDIQQYNLVIVSHTSSNRVYIKNHPLYLPPHRHCNSDLIYNDVAAHRKDHKTLETAASYFEQIFDVTYYEFIHNLILDKINTVLLPIKSLHLFPLYLPSKVPFNSTIDLRNIIKTDSGTINHFNKDGNEKVYHLVQQWIKENF